MANLYVDHGAYATNIGATPTWGVPQEGDGSATTAATASSTGSVAFSSVPTTGSITVFGASVSTSGVIGAANGDAAANALATNINATTNAVTTTFGIGTPQLRNFVFARGPSGGAPAGTCEIMCRVGSSTLNVTGIVSTLNGSPTLTQFTGGSGGCWGWLLNSAAIGVSSSIAALAYGILKAIPMVCSTVPGQADIVWCRSASGKTITSSASSFDLSHAFAVGATAAWSCHLIVDSNTKWTGDSGTGVVTIEFTALGNTANYLPGYSSSSSFVNAQQYVCSYGALVPKSLKFSFVGGGAGTNYTMRFNFESQGQSTEFWNCEFVDASTGSNSVRLIVFQMGVGGGGDHYGQQVFNGCTFRRVNSIANVLVTNLIVPATQGMTHCRFTGCKFVNNISGATAPAIVNLSSSGATLGGSFGAVISFNQCDFTGFSGGGNKFSLHDSSSAGVANNESFAIEAIDCTGISLTAAYAGLSIKRYLNDLQRQYILIHNPTGGGPYRRENLRGVVEWNPDASPAQPTLSAVQPTGTAWSLHARWLSTADVVDRAVGFELPPVRGVNQAAAAVKTITVESLMHSSLASALGPRDVSIVVSYVSNVTGLVVPTLITGVPASSSAAWTDAAGYPSHVARKWSFTTPDAVKQNTEISAVVTLRGSPRSGASESVFFDPELGVA